MKRNLTHIMIALTVAGISVAGTGCKRVDDSSKDTMSSGSSGVMSNSAAPNGTDNSDAAHRADASAGAAASSANATASQAGVNSSPPAQSSGAQ